MKDTKIKLLRTAAGMFARHGFDGVSVRDLVKKTGVNLCAINYYFGTKQKLYEAVMDDLFDNVKHGFADQVSGMLSQESDLAPAEEIKRIIGKFFDFLCSDSVSDMQAGLMIKEMLAPTAVYDKFYNGIFEPMHRHLSGLVAQIKQISPESDEAVLQTHMLLGQAMIFRIHRLALFRRLGIKKYTPEILAQIKRQLLQNCDILLSQGEIK